MNTIKLSSPISILYHDIDKYNIIYYPFLTSLKDFLGIEMYSLLLLYKFFFPIYFLRILYKYSNFNGILGKNLIDNLYNKMNDNSFVYLSDVNQLKVFVFELYTLSLSYKNIYNNMINEIKFYYDLLFK